MGFSTAQIVVAVVVSIIGTLILSAAGGALVYRNRRVKDQGKMRQPNSEIKRPVTSSSTSSGDVAWDEGNGIAGDEDLKSGDSSMGTRHSSLQTRVDWPFSISTVSPVSTRNSDSVQQSTSHIIPDSFPSPLTPGPGTAMPALSLFPKIQGTQAESPQRELFSVK